MLAWLSLRAGDSSVSIGALDVTAILPGILVFFAVTGVLSLSTGLGLRRFAPWARKLGLGLAVVDLPVLPFGTALGIYSLTLLPKDRVKALFHN